MHKRPGASLCSHRRKRRRGAAQVQRRRQTRSGSAPLSSLVVKFISRAVIDCAPSNAVQWQLQFGPARLRSRTRPSETRLTISSSRKAHGQVEHLSAPLESLKSLKASRVVAWSLARNVAKAPHTYGSEPISKTVQLLWARQSGETFSASAKGSGRQSGPGAAAVAAISLRRVQSQLAMAVASNNWKLATDNCWIATSAGAYLIYLLDYGLSLLPETGFSATVGPE